MGKNIPKITIITVCFNAVNLIERTIQSIINQNYSYIEYIIVDGDSKDGTIEIINKYSGNITKLISEKDNGLYDAMNKGIDLASGEWVLFMNAGDTFASDKIISEIFLANEHSADVIFGDTLNRYKWGFVFAEGRAFNGMERRMPFCHQSTFVRRNVLKDNKFDLSYKVSADHNQFYNLYKNGFKFKHLPIIISVFDTSGVSGYSICGIKEVCKINRYNSFKLYIMLFNSYIKVGIFKFVPNFLLDKYRKMKYKKYNLIVRHNIH